MTSPDVVANAPTPIISEQCDVIYSVVNKPSVIYSVVNKPQPPRASSITAIINNDKVGSFAIYEELNESVLPLSDFKIVENGVHFEDAAREDRDMYSLETKPVDTAGNHNVDTEHQPAFTITDNELYG